MDIKMVLMQNLKPLSLTAAVGSNDPTQYVEFVELLVEAINFIRASRLPVHAVIHVDLKRITRVTCSANEFLEKMSVGEEKFFVHADEIDQHNVKLTISIQ